MFISGVSSAIKRVCIGSKKQEEIVSSPKMSESKWPRHPWYKRLFNHRYKLALLPLLGTIVPDAHPKTNENVQVEIQAKQPSKTNSPYVRTTLNILCLVTLLDLLFSNQKRISHHELGHLLTHRLTQISTKLEHIKARGFVGGEVRCGDDEKHTEGTVESNLNRDIYSLLIFSQGGKSIEKLVYGYYRPISASLDSFAINLVSLLLPIYFFTEPRKLRDFLYFYFHLDKITQKLLSQVDPKVIEELADRLSKDHKWDSDQIQDIIKEFNLDKFPPFEEVIPEVKRLLED